MSSTNHVTRITCIQSTLLLKDKKSSIPYDSDQTIHRLSSELTAICKQTDILILPPSFASQFHSDPQNELLQKLSPLSSKFSLSLILSASSDFIFAMDKDGNLINTNLKYSLETLAVNGNAVGIITEKFQWSPQAIGYLSLEKSADFLLFPLESVPKNPSGHSSLFAGSEMHWKNVLKGHSAANLIPLISSCNNGQSAIHNEFGHCVRDYQSSIAVSAEFDLKFLRMQRSQWSPLRLCNFASINNDQKMSKKTLRMPAEWEPHLACLIGWPYRPAGWKEKCLPAQKAFKEVIDAISIQGGGKVLVYVSDKTQLDSVTLIFKDNSLVTVAQMDYDGEFFRDFSPLFTKNAAENKTICIRQRFNGYSHKTPFLKSQSVITKVSKTLPFEVANCPLVIEGGSIDTNGRGIFLCTKNVIMRRNPHLSLFEIEKTISSFFGVNQFLWADIGLYSDTVTDGHIDNLIKFVSEYELILHWPQEKSHPDYEASRLIYNKVQRMNDIKKFSPCLKVHKIIAPPIQRYEEAELEGLPAESTKVVGQQLNASYTNIFISSRVAVVPAFGVDTDVLALEKFEQIFEGRLKVVQIEGGRDIIFGGGGIHCITMNVPL